MLAHAAYRNILSQNGSALVLVVHWNAPCPGLAARRGTAARPTCPPGQPPPVAAQGGQGKQQQLSKGMEACPVKGHRKGALDRYAAFEQRCLLGVVHLQGWAAAAMCSGYVQRLCGYVQRLCGVACGLRPAHTGHAPQSTSHRSHRTPLSYLSYTLTTLAAFPGLITLCQGSPRPLFSVVSVSALCTAVGSTGPL